MSIERPTDRTTDRTNRIEAAFRGGDVTAARGVAAEAVMLGAMMARLIEDYQTGQDGQEARKA